MKKQSLTFILFLCILSLTSSCTKDWFDIKSDKNQTIPSTLEDLELLLDDYTTISENTPALLEISADGHHTLESLWPNFLLDNPDNNSEANGYTWSQNRPYAVVGDWNLSFKKIFVCNLVIFNIGKIDRTSENAAQYDRIKGNALFIKAKTYLELAQLYAEPIKAGANSQYGLPLRDGIDITEKSQRSTVKETYSFIENTTKYAIMLLPNRANIATRASKNSCYALLSRLYLITGNYEECVKYSDSSLRINNKLMDFDSLPTDQYVIGIFNPEVIFHSTMVPSYMLAIGGSYLDTTLFSKFNENDLRRTLFYLQIDSGYAFIGNYSNGIAKFSGLANDEILLNRAEAFARQNRLQQAMNDIDTLLKTRYKIDGNGNSTYQPFNVTSQREAIDIIIMERRKELVYRGIRWSDLRRLRNDPDHTLTIERTIGGQTYKLNQSYQYTLPIPEDELSFSGFAQNPGWSK